MAIKKVTFFSLLLFFSACSEDSVFTSFNNPEKLTGEEILFDLSDVAFPYKRLILHKNYLVFADSKSDYWIKVIDLDSAKVINKLGWKGRGPDEITFIYDIANVPFFPDLVYVNNAPNKELLLYNIDSIAAGSQKALKRISTPLNRLTFKLIPVGNACYLSESDQIMMNYLTLYDSDFNNLSEGLVIPDEISEDLSMLNKNLRAAAFSPQICFNRTGDKFCCCLSNSDYIEIFHLTDNNIKSIYRNYTFLPEIEILSNIKYAYKNLRGGIRLCSCTDKYIYLLVYNHILELAQDELGNGNDLIYIFNWDGTPEKAIQLDHKIGLFAIDKDDRTLYAFTYGEEIMKLVKYDLQ